MRNRPHVSSRVLLLGTGVALLVVAGIVIRRPPPAAAPPAPAAPAPAPASPPPAVLAQVTPQPPVLQPPEGYVGSEVCADCHGDEHTAWSRDWHARALTPASPQWVVGDFANSHYQGTSSEAWMSRRNETSLMRTQGASGAVSDYPVQWVIGGKRMQDPLTVLAGGRWQVLPVYFHVTGKGEWVDYSEAKQGRLGPDHPFFWANFRRNAQHECLDCHTSGLDVRYDRVSSQWSTHFADGGVACESCHGPGARHADTQEPKDIINPKKLAPARALAVCGQCHGPRRTLFPMLDSAHRFHPGERYEDHFQPVVLVVGGERSGDFFADGRPSTSSFEYQALLQSRCAQKGGATCLSCHTAPHGKHGADEVKQPRHATGTLSAGAETCRGCHAGLFAQGERHTHHQAAEAQDCVACHMPPVVSGVLDKFADHAIDVPVPENTVRHGVANACNVCHAQQSPQAMAEAVARWWPQAKARQQRRLRLADAFDEATAAQSRAPLEAVLADRKEAASLRGAAASLLALRFRKEALPALTAALAEPDPLLRSNVVEALGAVGARESTGALVPLLADRSLWVRQSAALALGSFGEARGAEALESLAREPASASLPMPHIVLGQLALRRGDLPGAERELEQALDLQPYSSDVLVMLADVYARLGDWAKAQARVREALRFNPQHQGARQRLTALGVR